MAKPYVLGQIGDFELKHLKIFKTVVDCGGLSAAETALSIGRSTISQHIANLESRLNLVLCKRGRGGFSLTNEGAIIYTMTEKLLESLEMFRVTVNHLNSTMSGELVIMLSDTISQDPRLKLPSILKSFSRQAPGVQIVAEVAPLAEIERCVLKDSADVGFVPFHRTIDGLKYLHIYEDTCYLYCSSDNPLANMPAEKITDDLLRQFATVHSGFKPHEAVEKQLSSMHLTASAYFYEVRVAIILSGTFIGFLPENFAQPYVDGGQLVAIDPQHRQFQLGMSAITHEVSQVNRARDLFMRILMEHIGKTEANA